VLDSLGAVVPDKSKFIIQLTGLKSDKNFRDGAVRNMLQVSQYPNAKFLPTAIRGLPTSLSAVDTASFEIMGNLTVRGTTKPTTWEVTAMFNQNVVTGTARSGFIWEDFGLTAPKRAFILSVADSLYLEFDFRLVPRTP
jgi:polyisoprenoid-binding protein YceI